MNTPIKLPMLPHPFKFKIHPEYKMEERDTHPTEMASRAFADKFGLYRDLVQRERLAMMNNAWCAAMMYPVGSLELLQVGADFSCWAVAYDDDYCDEGPLARDPEKFIQISVEIQRQFESPEHIITDDPYALGLRDIRLRLDRLATPSQIGRFVDGMRIYILFEIWKAVTPKPSISDYVLMRGTSGGAWAFPALAHVIAGVEITQDEYDDRKVRALTEMMQSLMAWETEPHAYCKEMVRGACEKEHNLIRVIMRECQCSFEAALEYYLDMRLCVLGLFKRLSNEIRQEASPGLNAYIDTLIAYYVGATAWSQSTRRYRSISGLETEGVFTHGELVEVDEVEERFESLGIASVDWWWVYDPARNKIPKNQWSSLKKPSSLY